MLLCLHINLAAQTFMALESVEVEYAQRGAVSMQTHSREERGKEGRQTISEHGSPLIAAQQMAEGY